MRQCKSQSKKTEEVLTVGPGDTVKRKGNDEYFLVAQPPTRYSSFTHMFSLTTGKHVRLKQIHARAWEKVTCCFKECEGD